MKSLQDSKKVLVATVATPTFDQYAALQVIATSLKSFSNKEIHLGVAGKISEKHKSALPIGDIKVLSQLPPKKFLLEFKNQKNKVKNIQWNQDNENLKFFLTMEKGNFNEEQPVIKSLGSDYETIILVGVNSFGDLGKLYSDAKDVFEDANIILVGGSAKGENLKVTHEFDDKHLSVCEDTYYFLSKNGIKFDSKGASALLAGIFFATKNFKKNLNDAKTFITSAELLKKGGTNEEAQRIVDAVKSEGKPQGGNSQGQSNNSGQKPSNGSNNQNNSKNSNNSGNSNNSNGSSNSNNAQGGNGQFKPMQNVSSNPQAPERVNF